jgi:hypothetical protein
MSRPAGRCNRLKCTIGRRTSPSTRTVLQALPKSRLLELGRLFSVIVPPEAPKEAQIDALLESAQIRFGDLADPSGVTSSRPPVGRTVWTTRAEHARFWRLVSFKPTEPLRARLRSPSSQRMRSRGTRPGRALGSVLDAPSSVLSAVSIVLDAAGSVLSPVSMMLDAGGIVPSAVSTVLSASSMVLKALGSVLNRPSTVVDAFGTVI